MSNKQNDSWLEQVEEQKQEVRDAEEVLKNAEEEMKNACINLDSALKKVIEEKKLLKDLLDMN